MSASVEGDPTVVELAIIVDELGTDERRVLLVVARRLLAGQACYGRLSVESDRRDWTKEAVEEGVDMLVYLAIRELATATKAKQ